MRFQSKKKKLTKGGCQAGEVFLHIDLDQLKIENQQYEEILDQRNNELLNLKVTGGNTLRQLSTNKKRLYKVMAELDKLKVDTRYQEDSARRLIEETGRVQKEVKEAQKTNVRLKQQLEEYRVPSVLDYVKLNSTLYELNKKIQDWERKVEIINMAWKKQKTKKKEKTIENTQQQKSTKKIVKGTTTERKKKTTEINL